MHFPRLQTRLTPFAVVIAIATPLFSGGVVNAYTQGQQPTLCTNPALPSDFQSQFTSVWPSAFDNDRKQIIYQSDTDHQLNRWSYWSVAPYNGLDAQLILSNHHITINGGSDTRSTNSSNMSFFLGSVTPAADVVLEDVFCIGYVGGETYASSWQGKQLSGSEQTPPDPYPEPNFFTDPGGWLKWFFVPKSQMFTDFTTNMGTFMTDKLGFLTYPFTVVSNYANQFISLSPQCTFDLPYTQFYGVDVTNYLNVCAWRDASPISWDFVMLPVRALTALGLLFAIYRSWRETITA